MHLAYTECKICVLSFTFYNGNYMNFDTIILKKKKKKVYSRFKMLKKCNVYLESRAIF